MCLTLSSVDGSDVFVSLLLPRLSPDQAERVMRAMQGFALSAPPIPREFASTSATYALFT